LADGPPRSGTEATLLKRIQQYDTDALAQVYDDYYERIYRYIYRYLGQADVAEDLTANVFLRLLKAVHNGRCPRKNLAAWLYRVAHNLVVDTFRRRPAEELELAEWLESDDPDPLHIADLHWQMKRVRLALRHLTESQQQVIVLKFIEGMNSREVAAILGKSEGAIDALQHRALVALRRLLTSGQGPGAASQAVKGNTMGHTEAHDQATMTGMHASRRLLAWLRLAWLYLSKPPMPPAAADMHQQQGHDSAQTRLTWEVAP